MLGYVVILNVDVLKVFCQINAFALRFTFRLDDESFVARLWYRFKVRLCFLRNFFTLLLWCFLYFDLFEELSFEQIHLIWQNIGGRQKVIFFGKFFHHSHHVLTKFVFVRNHLNARKL